MNFRFVLSLMGNCGQSYSNLYTPDSVSLTRQLFVHKVIQEYLVYLSVAISSGYDIL